MKDIKKIENEVEYTRIFKGESELYGTLCEKFLFGAGKFLEIDSEDIVKSI